MPNQLARALAVYLKQARLRTESRALFVHHQSYVGRSMSARSVRDVIRRGFERCGIAARGTHILRHTWATCAHRRGASLKLIADILGHSSLQTTLRYGEELVRRLAADLTKQFGRGFGFSQLKIMRQFYQVFPDAHTAKPLILQSTVEKSRTGQSVIGQSKSLELSPAPISQSLIGQFSQRSSAKLSRAIEHLGNIARAFPPAPTQTSAPDVTHRTGTGPTDR